MAWLCTWCETDTEEAAYARRGQGQWPGKEHGQPAPMEKMIHKWRVLDEGSQIHAEGISSSDSSFAPLDYFRDDAGITDIEYEDPQQPGRWLPL